MEDESGEDNSRREEQLDLTEAMHPLNWTLILRSDSIIFLASAHKIENLEFTHAFSARQNVPDVEVPTGASADELDNDHSAVNCNRI